MYTVTLSVTTGMWASLIYCEDSKWTTGIEFMSSLDNNTQQYATDTY